GGCEIAEWDTWGRSFRAAGPTAPPLPAAAQLERSPHSPDVRREEADADASHPGDPGGFRPPAPNSASMAPTSFPLGGFGLRAEERIFDSNVCAGINRTPGTSATGSPEPI